MSLCFDDFTAGVRINSYIQLHISLPIVTTIREFKRGANMSLKSLLSRLEKSEDEDDNRAGGGGPTEEQREVSTSYRTQRQKRLKNDNKIIPHPMVSSFVEDEGKVDEHDYRPIAPLSGVTTWWRLLFQSSEEEDMYDIYLNFKDKNLQSEEKRLAFLSFKRSDSNIPVQFFVLVLMGIYVGTRFWFTPDLLMDASYSYVVSAIIFAGLVILCLGLNLMFRLSLISLTHHSNLFRLLHPIAKSFYNSSYGQCLDDGIVISGALSSGLFLISCVHVGNVPIASDVMILSFIVVVVFQLVARGVSRIGLICAWMIMIVCINVSLHVVGTGNQEYLYLNGELLLLLALSYEIERRPLRQYIMSVRVSDASDDNATALAKTVVVVAAENRRRHSLATTKAEALASTAKLLAAANEIEHVAAYTAKKAFATTVKLLSAENDAQKLVAAAEAKALATTALLLAAANELHNEHAVELATTLANTGILLLVVYISTHSQLWTRDHLLIHSPPSIYNLSRCM